MWANMLREDFSIVQHPVSTWTTFEPPKTSKCSLPKMEASRKREEMEHGLSHLPHTCQKLCEIAQLPKQKCKYTKHEITFWRMAVSFCIQVALNLGHFALQFLTRNQIKIELFSSSFKINDRFSIKIPCRSFFQRLFWLAWNVAETQFHSIFGLKPWIFDWVPPPKMNGA